MKLFEQYLNKVYEENMQGSLAPGLTSKEFTTGKGAASPTTTYELELAGNTITGRINNQNVTLSLQDFSAQYPDLAREILAKLQTDGVAKYAPDDKRTIDFRRNPQTKNTLMATPDQQQG